MSEALAAEHRQALASLTTLTLRDLRRIWLAAQNPNAAVVRDVLMDAVPLLAEAYGDMAGALAADYYEDVREQAEAPGRHVAQPAALPGTARYEALVRWGVDPLFQEAPEALLALSRIGGGLQRIVSDVSRETIATNSVRDPQAQGWIRIASPGACSFCRMLADRRGDGQGVYKESTVRFASHDDCGCSAAPAFSPGRSVSTVPYVASKRKQSDTDRARVREYLHANL